MVVVISHAILVERRRSCRLDSPEQPLFNKGSQNIVDGLPGNCADFRADHLRNGVGVPVRTGLDCPENGHALGSDWDAMFAKESTETVHG